MNEREMVNLVICSSLIRESRLDTWLYATLHCIMRKLANGNLIKTSSRHCNLWFLLLSAQVGLPKPDTVLLVRVGRWGGFAGLQPLLPKVLLSLSAWKFWHAFMLVKCSLAAHLADSEAGWHEMGRSRLEILAIFGVPVAVVFWRTRQFSFKLNRSFP